MKRLLMSAVIFAALTGAAGAKAECPEADAAMLALPLHDFDQTEQGWRSLDGEGCERQAAEAIRRYRADLLNVHLDDVRDGVHDHLQIGEGEIPWPDVLGALEGFTGVASVELARHSHDAPRAAATAMERLRSALPTAAAS